jgi:Protein of unknown function (DUF3999)
MMLRSAVLLILTLSAASTSAAPTDDYAYAWPLATEGDSAAWQVELVPEVYAAIRTDELRDVVVVNAAGEPVPFAPYRPVAAPAAPELVELPLFVLPAANAPAGNGSGESIGVHIERGTDGRLRRLDAEVGGTASGLAAPQNDVLLDASAVHVPLAGLTLDWSDDEDVTAQFSISGSDDLQQWHVLVGNAIVMRLAQHGAALTKHEVALGNTPAAYLRLRRLDSGAALPELRVRARTTPLSTGVAASDLWLSATPDANGMQLLHPELPANDLRQRTVYTYRLPAVLEVRAVRVELADDNSVAQAEVASRSRDRPGGSAQWIANGSVTAFRLRQGDSIIGNDSCSVSPRRAGDWRVELTAPPEHAPALFVAYRPDRFVFLAQGNGPYRLLAGSAQAHRADYPVDAALAQLRGRLGADWQPPLAALGARATLGGERAFEPAQPQRDWKTWLLWGVLIAAAAVIGALALHLVRTEKQR